MSYYEDVYLKRLNRYGYDYATRLQKQRERVFEDLLIKSIYRIDFMYDGALQPGLLERYKQDDTQTIQYLLTRVSLNIPHGTVLEIPDKDGLPQKWMIYYLEQIEASGYNRYFVIRITHTLHWHSQNNFEQDELTAVGYFHGPHYAALRNVLQSTSRSTLAVYSQDDSNYIAIMPFTANFDKDDYVEITANVKDTLESFRVMGCDRQTNPGVMYVTLDPIYAYDKSATPVKPLAPTPEESEEYYWFEGGGK